MFFVKKSVFNTRLASAFVAGAIGVAGALLPNQAVAGPGDLLVTPTRVVLEGRERSAELTLVNRGQERTTYRITLENRRMDAQGKFSEIDTPKDGELFAQNLIRYAPRRVTLEPNKPQTPSPSALRGIDHASLISPNHRHRCGDLAVSCC